MGNFRYRCPDCGDKLITKTPLDEFSRDCIVCGAPCEQVYTREKPTQNLAKTVVYVAGPYRGNVEANVKIAEMKASQLALGGLSFICPHSNGSPHDSLGLSDQYWLDMTLEIMRRCDAVYAIGNWQKSEGTLGEIREAYRLGKPVFFNSQLLFEWARGQ